ncbi:trypsin-like [Schistocerca americana]|uniref:trypsin-like n=1 Tax=Schistocerca americana TaxID=7009 RepID=UPI001F4F8E2B|nr:trypsin-like [Schistocerca americana]
MLRWTSFLLLAAVAANCVTGATTMQAVSPLNGRIVNGEPAERGEFPSQLSLQKNGAHWCGASIIGDYWAITAAHCVDSVGSYDVMEVRAGVTNLKEEGSLHAVDVITVHPQYDPSDSWVNDIALLKVSPAFPIDGVTVAPVQLPPQGEEVPDGANVTVIGWGSLWGDSGGPVLYGGVLQGLTSWGYECATPPYPGIYTRVASYVDWIHRHTGTSWAPNWRP